MTHRTPLGREIAELIGQDGPITLDRYMALCLAHPAHGYYLTRDPLGRAGDFITAPEISQMFGELLGLWVAQVWAAMGRPGRFVLAELGPGRGTLMADALRALRLVPECLAALDLHLVETSPVLERRQRETLAAAGMPATWLNRVEALPRGPAIVLANEFLDALPIRQFERARTGWHERLVGLGEGGTLALGLMTAPEPSLAGRAAPDGAVLEIGEAASALAGLLARRLAAEGGAALFIDYGHAEPGFGDTFQALARHARADPLERPGEADLTAHVDFAAIAGVAVAQGARAHGPATQADFLEALGIGARADRLGRDASEAARAEIAVARRRLTGTSPSHMGALFKVLGLSHPGLAELPGLVPGFARPSITLNRKEPSPC